MTAMDNATRNAGDLVDKLTINYNRSRHIYYERVNWNNFRAESL